MLPFLSLDGALSPGPGAAKDLEGLYGTHTLAVFGSPTGSFQVVLEGSHDGAHWFRPSAGDVITNQTQEPFRVTTQTGSLYRYVRANVVTHQGGTISATIASA